MLRAEIGSGRAPSLSSASYTAGNAVRTWKTIDDFMQEVAAARIYDGVRYRNSTEVGNAMGRQIGELALKNFPRPIR